MSSLDGYNDRYRTRAADSNPRESWWLDADRFYDRARLELPRMTKSEYGQKLKITTATEAGDSAERFRKSQSAYAA